MKISLVTFALRKRKIGSVSLPFTLILLNMGNVTPYLATKAMKERIRNQRDLTSFPLTLDFFIGLWLLLSKLLLIEEMSDSSRREKRRRGTDLIARKSQYHESSILVALIERLELSVRDIR